MIDIVMSKRGTFVKNGFYTASTSANKFYPFYSQHSKEYIGRNVFLYHKPKFVASFVINKYADLYSAFSERMTTLKYKFEVDSVEHYVYVNKGIMVDELHRPLLVLTVTDFDNSLTNEYDWRYKPDYSKFRLFVATDFLSNPIYKVFWRKIDKDIVQEFILNGIPVEFNSVENIEKQVFSNNFNIEFDNITQLHNHLQNNVTQLLFNTLSEDIISEELQVFRDEQARLHRELQSSIEESTTLEHEGYDSVEQDLMYDDMSNNNPDIDYDGTIVSEQGELFSSIFNICRYSSHSVADFQTWLNNYYSENLVDDDVRNFHLHSNSTMIVSFMSGHTIDITGQLEEHGFPTYVDDFEDSDEDSDTDVVMPVVEETDEELHDDTEPDIDFEEVESESGDTVSDSPFNIVDDTEDTVPYVRPAW